MFPHITRSVSMDLKDKHYNEVDMYLVAELKNKFGALSLKIPS